MNFRALGSLVCPLLAMTGCSDTKSCAERFARLGHHSALQGSALTATYIFNLSDLEDGSQKAVFSEGFGRGAPPLSVVVGNSAGSLEQFAAGPFDRRGRIMLAGDQSLAGVALPATDPSRAVATGCSLEPRFGRLAHIKLTMPKPLVKRD